MCSVLRTFKDLTVIQKLMNIYTRPIIKTKKEIHSSTLFRDKSQKTDVVSADSFNNVKEKTKSTYLDMLRMYQMERYRSGHVEFINTAIKHMEEFGVAEDIETYKKLIQVLPAGKFVPQNYLQSEFMHYPKHQQCIIDLLQKMEDNGVIPDWEMEDMLIKRFGPRGFPVRRYWRMMYWMPKFNNLSPWPIPKPAPNDPYELALLAVKRICSVDVESEVKVYNTKNLEENFEDTWIVSGQSADQKKLIANQSENVPIYIEGGFRLWLRKQNILYFILRTEPPIKPKQVVDEDDVSNFKVPFFDKPINTSDKVVVKQTVHEQEDGTILAVCATGTSSKNSLLSWIRFLEQDGNPRLSKLPILFMSKSPLGNVEPLSELLDQEHKNESDKKMFIEK
ncbi:evolutionarily conserved signaling intermediate in Toll pathway, mitochondrial [Daktulosphaira vitifoliae]|uniref:evolutionarily conserved signaling intermediate in Toll pathway, mitochondrial n=1 Tax=Daktulosphaira vitifoliae TaxID=58002 RepID=UPI0021AAF343|nr:evolutionarily conserved signaling intermediate in Toll pathway, mitochondrial [Daktulosphaira vitifoliae]